MAKDIPSTSPLYKKLGIKQDSIVHLVEAPAYFFDLIADRPDGVIFSTEDLTKKDIIIFFITNEMDLLVDILSYRKLIKSSGMIWIAWPKLKSKIPRSINENRIREIAIEHRLVDVKVCSIDDQWSALKLVIPVKDR